MKYYKFKISNYELRIHSFNTKYTKNTKFIYDFLIREIRV
jgi:hypothetical protein